MYVKRDTGGRIVLVSTEPGHGCDEYVEIGSPELLLFVDDASAVAGQQGLMRQSDLDFVRVLEDLIGVLIDKSVIRFTDLPQEAQHKLSERHFMRDHISSVGLLGESGDDDGFV